MCVCIYNLYKTYKKHIYKACKHIYIMILYLFSPNCRQRSSSICQKTAHNVEENGITL